MINVIRRRQMVEFTVADRNPSTRYAVFEDIWADNLERGIYFASGSAYPAIEKGTVVEPGARFYDRLSWIEDWLLDWDTADIAAYVLGGDAALPLNGRVAIAPDGIDMDDIDIIEADAVVVKDRTADRLKRASQRIKGALNAMSRRVKQLVKRMGDRLHSFVSS